jgi:hypothetical protein
MKVDGVGGETPRRERVRHTAAGTTVQVMPAPGKPSSVFQDDDAICRNFANSQVAGAPEQANVNLVGSAVVGTLLGTALGAAIGRGPGAPSARRAAPSSAPMAAPDRR